MYYKDFITNPIIKPSGKVENLRRLFIITVFVLAIEHSLKQ